MPDATINTIMNKMQGAFQAENAKGIDTVVQFDIGGENGGKWVLTIKDQQCKVNQGTTPNPKLTFISNEQTFLDIFTGKQDGVKAYMLGKVRMIGDITLALKLPKLFKVN
jgi:putative sterol carrier protein